MEGGSNKTRGHFPVPTGVVGGMGGVRGKGRALTRYGAARGTCPSGRGSSRTDSGASHRSSDMAPLQWRPEFWESVAPKLSQNF